MILGLVLSIDGTVHQGKGWCLKSVLYFFGAMAEYLNGYVSGTILACGAIEGVIVGLEELRRRQTNQLSREQGIQEGIRQENERLRQSIFLCPVWGTPASLFPTARKAAVFGIDSPQAGGKYEISLQLLAELVNGSVTFTEQDKEAITQWLAVHRAEGSDLPVLTDDVVRNEIRRGRSVENGTSHD